MQWQIVDLTKFHRPSIIICVHRCIGKPIHLRSLSLQRSAAVLSFALKVLICYEQRNGHYLVLGTISLVYFNVKINKQCKQL